MSSDKTASIKELRRRMEDVTPLERDDENFFRSEETLARYLKARDWKIDDAEKLLRATVEYRRKMCPQSIDCIFCHERPGFHSMRQVGFDEIGRPVIYSCFAQAVAHRNNIEDTIVHVTYLIENAKLSMKEGITSWVFIIDCTGMAIPTCNPKLGYGVTQVLSNHYPERLGMVICINHNPVFQGVWKAIRVFLHPNTVAKMKLLRSKLKIVDTFQKYFSEEMTHWLLEEIRLNRHKPLPRLQREFWKPPSNPEVHDPRGCRSYVEHYIESEQTSNGRTSGIYKTHPNIIDYLQGNIKDADIGPVECEEQTVDEPSDEEVTGSDDENSIEINIDEEFQIPKDAFPIGS